MTSLRKMSSLCTAFVLAVALACAPDAPTQPSAVPNLDLIGNVTGTVTGTTDLLAGPVHGLLSCTTTQSYSSSARIGSAGGTLQVGPHTLVVPKGALGATVKISATAPAGDIVQVHFEPAGLKFAKSTTLSLSYAQCGLQLLPPLRIVYIDGNRSILEILPSAINLLNQSVTGPVSHFSNYALAE